MKNLLLPVILSMLSLLSFAQFPGGGMNRGGGGMNLGHFYGKIIDATTKKPVEYASVQLIGNKMDSITRKRKDTIVAGMFTDKRGEFSFENLAVMGQYRLKITAIGYQTFEQKVAFELKFSPGQDMTQLLNNVDKDLGNISIKPDVKQLSDVVITANTPTLQLGVDRKIFNVDRNITSVGGTAVDVMRNVPTLNVDVDGNITLRNNAPQIFVDGRPTTLSLDQIPADAIQSVELITNPSAKYDASGGQSSILNIVLKKNKKAGYNGNLRAGIDMRARVNAGADLNARQGKVNFFLSGNYNQRKSIASGATDRNNFADNPVNTIHQDNDNTTRGQFAFTRFGLDYFIDNRNTISVTQSFVFGKNNTSDLNDFRYDTAGVYTTQYRDNYALNKFQNIGNQLSFKHNFTKPGKELTADITYNRVRSNNDADIRIRSFDMSGSPKFPEVVQTIDGGGKTKFFVGQVDYVNPVNDNTKWEMGARTQIRTFESFQYNYFNGVLQPSLTNDYNFTDYVHAAYVTFSQKKPKANLNYQIGLRAESSKYDGEQKLPSGIKTFKNDFPVSLFPSIFLSKSFKKKQDVQLNFTRRINRPNFFQLMPNTDYSDPLNFQTGNPNLKPEFTYSVESSYQKQYGKKNNTFLATTFFKYTDNLIARYQRRNKVAGDAVVDNGVIPDSAFVTTYVNASSSYALGLELVFRNTISKWWEINYNFNLYYSKINGSSVVPDLANERTSWFVKTNNTFKLGKGWTAQLSGDYLSKSILPVSTSNSGSGGGGRGGMMGGGYGGGSLSTTQGYIDANYYVDLGLRKEFKIKNNTATISLNWSDIFRTRKNVVYSESSYFNQLSYRRRDPQFVRLNFSYRFGKMDVTLFKRKNMKNAAEGLDIMQ
jgi:outer membrane receptor protein involved in Fe transport